MNEKRKAAIDLLCSDDFLNGYNELYNNMRELETFFAEEMSTSTLEISKSNSSVSSVLNDVCTALFSDENEETYQEFMNAFEMKNEEDFYKVFRITIDTFNFILTRILENNKINFEGQITPNPKINLMMTLWFLGHQCSFTQIKEKFGVAQGTAFELIYDTVNWLADMASEFITWPTHEKSEVEEQKFRYISNIPGITGVVGSCNIRTRTPVKDPENYLDSNSQTYNTHLLAVCDSEKKFTYIYTGYPGSAPPHEVLASSDLGGQLRSNENNLFLSENYHLAGDSSFVLKEHLIVPFKDTRNRKALTPSQKCFNSGLEKAINVLDTAFQWLKCRFKRLKFMDGTLQKNALLVTAACVIHNIALMSEEERILIHMQNDMKFDISEINIYSGKVIESPRAMASFAAKEKRMQLARSHDLP